MRRLLVIVALLGIMLGVRALQADGGGGAHDPLTLAAIGFVLLTAFTVSELGALLGLPRVTGYIVGGALLGPSASNILSSQVVVEMRMFNTLALGLIATSAGLELDLRQIRKVWRTLMATVVFKVAGSVVLVGGGLWLLQRTTSVLTLADPSHLYALVLVFSALAIGTSPAITLALLSEGRVKGRIADIFLGSAVVKDLVVVVALAIALGLARPLLGDSGAHEGVLVGVAKELGASLLAGAVLGGVLIAYVRFVRAEMLLFVAAMILVVSEVGRALHLELLLVFITAGCVVRNGSEFEHQLMKPVELVAVPIFVVFFTNAGANIDLSAALDLLPVAITLCSLRALAFWLAARFGGKIGAEAPAVVKSAWLGYLPQAGVTLGLVGLAAEQLPPLHATIASLGMAVVALNLLVGPLTLRFALSRLKGPPAAVPDGPSEVSPGKIPAAPHAVEAASPDTEPPRWQGSQTEPLLNQVLQQLHDDVLGRGRAFCASSHSQLHDQIVGPLRTVLKGLGDREVGTARLTLAALSWPPVPELAGAARELFKELRGQLRALPSSVKAGLAKESLQLASGDNLLLRLRKRRRRLRMVFSAAARLRVVPLRIAARAALERRFSSWASQQVGSYSRLRAALLLVVRQCARNQVSAVEASATVERLLQRWQEGAESDLSTLLDAGLNELADRLLVADTPEAPSAAPRLSGNAATIQADLEVLNAGPAEWERVLRALQTALLLELELHRTERSFNESLSEALLVPAHNACSALLKLIESIQRQLQALDAGPPDEAGGAATLRAWRSAFAPEAIASLEDGAARLRSSAPQHRLALELRGAIELLPETTQRVRTSVRPSELVDPSGVRFRAIEPRRLAIERLVERMLPRTQEHLGRVTVAIGSALDQLREVDALVSHALEHRDSAPPDIFARASRLLDRAVAELSAAAERIEPDLLKDARDAFADTIEAFSDEIVSGSHRDSGALARRLSAALVLPAQRLVAATGKLSAAWIERAREYANLDVLQSLRAQYGASELHVAEMWAITQAWQGPPNLPTGYGNLFDGTPVRETRLFSVHRTELKQLVEAEAAWLRGGPGSALVVGAHGAGRTSLLNICQLELAAPRVLRPELSGRRRRGALFRALASELDTANERTKLREALVRTRTTVLVDDLESWFEADLEGVLQLERFLELVVQTRREVCWIATISVGAYQLFRELLPLEQLFAQQVELAPLSARELRAAVEKRHRLSGMPLEFPAAFGVRLLRKLGPGSEANLYFGLLARITEGNLALALRVFARSAEVEGGRVRVHTERSLKWGLTFLGQLSATDIAVLLQSLRFGALEPRQLAVSTGLSAAQLRYHLSFLESAGLLERSAQRGERALGVPRALRPLVHQSLVRLGMDSEERHVPQ